MKTKKSFSLIMISLMYVIACAIGIIIYRIIPLSFPFKLLFADIAGTIFIFIFSLIFNNASCYDAYWSAAPIAMVICLVVSHPLNLARFLASLLVLIWGLRLTLNWVYTFDNLEWEDWRYRDLKEKSKRLYPFVNFFGIHLFPTLIVYGCMLPVFYLFYNDNDANILIVIFYILGVAAVLLEGIADLQMHKFQNNKTSTFIRSGVWKYSRHPNYLGEISFWFMLAMLVISSIGGSWYLLIGAIANMLLFLFISIPLAETHQRSRKEGFDQYKEETRMLLPIPKKTK